MPILVHHKPIDPARSFKLHLWGGIAALDLPGTVNLDMIDFTLPDVDDARTLQFKFHSTDAQTHEDVWEGDDFSRRIRLVAPAKIWSFENAARILYQDPFPPNVTFQEGDVLTFNVITQNRFNGGRLYAWSPYDAAKPTASFPETSRQDTISTFAVELLAWMTSGFHFKLAGPGKGGSDFEPDSSNRVWRPGDGAALYLKSGQVSVRRQPLKLTSVPIDVLLPATPADPPPLTLADPIDNWTQTLTPTASTAPAGPLFRVARYTAAIYADAAYNVSITGDAEIAPPFVRPFPADSTHPAALTRFIAGVDGWTAAVPAPTAVTLIIQPRAASTFTNGLSVQAGVGSGPANQTVNAALQADGTWQAKLDVLPNVANWLRLRPTNGDEPRPYQDIDTRRNFTPPLAATTYFTAEGVYGMTARGAVAFAEPPSRSNLMQAAFGSAAVVFAATEMPHGATLLGSEVYFVVHAPHAAWAALVLVDEQAAGGPTCRTIPMSLTADTLYWWCKMPAATAAAGTRYHFLLNDDQEVMDPAARAVLDRGDFATAFGDDPKDPKTSWSLVLDSDRVRTTAHATSWDTLGWESLLMYEINPKRFTDLSLGSLTPLDVLADELQPVSRLNKPGYLRNLPITALLLMPLQEFKSSNSWGYNPAFFFAIDGNYGGAAALARLASACHAAGRGVLLDVVYNHMNDSPLTQIARDVYRNGDAWGDRINNAHPMVKEFFRQATVYLWRTFALDGFRFDATSTIVDNNGWDFLGTLRAAVRTAAAAEGRHWPYFVAENDPKSWDITNPAWGVMDGQWDIDEVYRLRDVSYDPWQPADDHAPGLQADMNLPQTWGRSFAEATRFGESHDMVSGQDAGNKRVAARPPFGKGLQMAKAVGTVPLLSNGVPMLFMGQEVGETRFFSFDNDGPVTNPQQHDLPLASATDNTRVLSWFRSLMGLRNDPVKGLRGNDNVQAVHTGRRTIAFSAAAGRLFVVVTFGTPDQRQDSSWLGLPQGPQYKEIFNSSWPAFQVEFEPEHTNGGYAARISAGQLLNLPNIGAVVLERI